VYCRRALVLGSVQLFFLLNAQMRNRRSPSLKQSAIWFPDGVTPLLILRPLLTRVDFFLPFLIFRAPLFIAVCVFHPPNPKPSAFPGYRSSRAFKVSPR